MLYKSNFSVEAAVANCGAMEADTISNMVRTKNMTSNEKLVKKAFFALLSTFIVVSGMWLSACGNANAQKLSSSNAPERWEYMLLEIPSYDWHYQSKESYVIGFHQRINELGTEGWELVSTNIPDLPNNFIFKRKL